LAQDFLGLPKEPRPRSPANMAVSRTMPLLLSFLVIGPSLWVAAEEHSYEGCYGVEEGAAWSPAMGFLTGKKDDTITNQSNWRSCQVRCSTTRGCAHFSFWEENGACLLQDKDATRVPFARAISGPPVCGEAPPPMPTNSLMNANAEADNMVLGAAPDSVTAIEDGTDVAAPQAKNLVSPFQLLAMAGIVAGLLAGLAAAGLGRTMWFGKRRVRGIDVDSEEVSDEGEAEEGAAGVQVLMKDSKWTASPTMPGDSAWQGAGRDAPVTAARWWSSLPGMSWLMREQPADEQQS